MAILLKQNNSKSSQILPLIPLRKGLVFPNTESVLSFGRSKSVAAIDTAYKGNRLICLAAQKNSKVKNPDFNDIYKVGTLCTIQRLLKTNGEADALVKGITRVSLEELKTKTPFLMVKASELKETGGYDDEIKALVRYIINQLKKAVNLGKSMEFLVFMKLMSEATSFELADQVANVLQISTKDKQKLLEMTDVKLRLEQVSEHLSQELKVLEIEHSINSKTQKKFDKSMREAVLRERMKTIQKELGKKEENKEGSGLKKKIKLANMPKKVEKKALKELSRLQKMHSYNPEAGYIRTYLDWLIDVPWKKKSRNNTSLKKAEKVLEGDHYGLNEVKERVLEYLAVMKLKGDSSNKKEGGSPTILCFAGPPGVGKTSMGRSIAKALGREFVRMSLGGIRDEAEIRGHRRTYVGALPGRIIQGIKNAGTKNPVFMLDEIDKIGIDFRGDPSAALLETLDPEQNHEFTDHYLEVPFDLSEVMFITTANVLETIPPALKDRLEIIRFSGYTYDEKAGIAKKFLMNKTLRSNGLKKSQINLTKAVLSKIIQRYTREAGVRNLEREISKIMRKAAKKIASDKRTKKVKVVSKNLADFLGPPKFSATLAEKKDEVGVATGLAWTQAGGEILFIEVALMPGKGSLILTGHLGDVMKESCKAALSFVRSRWQKLGIGKNETKKLDIHVHVPEGAVKKDGPSAGIAIAVALTSALTDRKIKKEVGMTGEITLRGRALQIGGIKEKVVAAHQAGLKEIIMPKDNKKDLVKVPDHIKKDFKFHFISSLDEALKVVLKK
jgi:ATP-dependent Lon protease